MSMPTDQEAQGSSTRPYLIRALHDWCTDNGFTPYLAVYVDRAVQVPREYVKNNEIVLNVSFEATSNLQLGNEFIEFKARFGGMGRDISVPIDHVIAIYARENGQGMAFPVPTSLGGDGVDSPSSPDDGSGLASASAPVTEVLVDTPDDRRPPSLSLARTGKQGAPQVAAKERPTMKSVEITASNKPVDGTDEPTDTPPTSGGGRPSLRRIK